ncbi:uncharacterized protein EI90DRAFT_453136 [Cantharellus anzutake]|uniref:uncharacterized protein n=1 Tax=Cantharellus anzutake TaxID=1750568 RepID=UPI0019085263|nr:uncharacterized protein EI90DRAFT_453136 [Cantharellus anzutake]KAF8334697.1 hypothetical protein EI90DRAFT_453136 [Cantharellus anzutake]
MVVFPWGSTFLSGFWILAILAGTFSGPRASVVARIESWSAGEQPQITNRVRAQLTLFVTQRAGGQGGANEEAGRALII